MPLYHPFRTALMRMQRVSTLAELADVVVQQMQRVTGFERVMFYRFHEDGHGSVDAEAKAPEFETYLGLHYPASDIPAQARQLYLKNWLRLIFDARATPARIVPTSARTRAGHSTSVFRCCVASRPFTSNTWQTWESAPP
jgi:chemotaxis family two-component system sensor kinase Cph1